MAAALQADGVLSLSSRKRHLVRQIACPVVLAVVLLVFNWFHYDQKMIPVDQMAFLVLYQGCGIRGCTCLHFAT